MSFLHTPVYSPGFNPAEYLIRLVRKTSLYPLSVTLTVQARAHRVQRHLAQTPPQTPQQPANILRHIDRLPIGGDSALAEGTGPMAGFTPVGRRRGEVECEGGAVTGDAGGLPLRASGSSPRAAGDRG